jgi:hypothetical protein
MIIAEVIVDLNSISKMSLVKEPAIEVDFLKLSDEKPTIKLANEELREVVGAALIPNKKYYRKKEFFQKTLDKNEDGYIFFNEANVKLAAMSFLKSNNKINIQHSEDVNDGDVDLVESWIIEDKNDKAYKVLNFDINEIPIGSWMLREKINNEEIWKDIKKGNINGYSIEGSPQVIERFTSMKMQKDIDEDELVNQILTIIKNIK